MFPQHRINSDIFYPTFLQDVFPKRLVYAHGTFITNNRSKWRYRLLASLELQPLVFCPIEMPVSTSAYVRLYIPGTSQTCTEEGERVAVDIIANIPCIKCYCKVTEYFVYFQLSSYEQFQLLKFS